MTDIYELVGAAIGDIGHIRIAGGMFALCGTSIIGYIIGGRFFMPHQSNCNKCLKNYAARRKPRKVTR